MSQHTKYRWEVADGDAKGEVQGQKGQRILRMVRIVLGSILILVSLVSAVSAIGFMSEYSGDSPVPRFVTHAAISHAVMWGVIGLLLVLFGGRAVRRRRLVVDLAREMKSNTGQINIMQIVQKAKTDEGTVRKLIVKHSLDGYVAAERSIPEAAETVDGGSFDPLAWHVACVNCKAWFDQRPKRSGVLGFRLFQCPECKREVVYPLTNGLRLFYLVLGMLVGLPALFMTFINIMVIVEEGNPNSIGGYRFFVPGALGFAGILSLCGFVKDEVIRRKLRVLDKRYGTQGKGK